MESHDFWNHVSRNQQGLDAHGEICEMLCHTQAWADQPEVFDPLSWDLCCEWGKKTQLNLLKFCLNSDWFMSVAFQVRQGGLGYLCADCSRSRLDLFARPPRPESFEECKGERSALWFIIMFAKNSRAAKLPRFFVALNPTFLSIILE